MTSHDTPPQESTINPGTFGALVNVKDVHLNVSQALIITTEDRVRINLSNHLSKIEMKKAWIAPLSVLVTIVLTLVTAEFKKPGLLWSPETWQAVFIISAVLSIGWLMYTIKQAWQSESVEDLIEKLKRDSR